MKKPIDIRNIPLTLTPRESLLGLTACACGAVACLMTGMVIGMLISPRKNLTIGSHNGGNVIDKRVSPEQEETV